MIDKQPLEHIYNEILSKLPLPKHGKSKVFDSPDAFKLLNKQVKRKEFDSSNNNNLSHSMKRTNNFSAGCEGTSSPSEIPSARKNRNKENE